MPKYGSAISRDPSEKAGEIPSPLDFAAKGDGVILDDGQITAGSDVLTSNTAGFIESDIGKLLTVQKAGSLGDLIFGSQTPPTFAPLHATILAVSNPVTGVKPLRYTSVKLSLKAGASVALGTFLYGTEDTASINRAFDGIFRSGRNYLFVPGGIYMHSGILNAKSGITIEGSGPASMFFSTGPDAASLKFKGCIDSGVKSLKFFNWDTYRRIANENSQVLFDDCRSCFAKDVYVDGSATVGVFVFNSADTRVTNPTINNTLADGVHIRASVNTQVDSPKGVNTGDSMVGIAAVVGDVTRTDIVKVNDLLAINCLVGCNISGATNITINNPTVINPRAHGIEISRQSSFQTLPASIVTISGGLISGANKPGYQAVIVYDDAPGTPTDHVTRVKVDGTSIKDSNLVLARDAAEDIEFINLKLDNCLGIIALSCFNVNTDGCRIKDCPSDRAVIYDGVTFGSINANTLENVQTVGHPALGAIDVSGCVGVVGNGNVVLQPAGWTGQSIGPIRVTGGSNSHVGAVLVTPTGTTGISDAGNLSGFVWADSYHGTFSEKITAAKAVLGASGGTILLKEDVYNLLGQLTLPRNIRLQGRLIGGTRIQYSGTGVAFAFADSGSIPAPSKGGLSDITLYGAGIAAGIGLFLGGYPGGDARSDPTPLLAAGAITPSASFGDNLTFDRVRIENFNTGIRYGNNCQGIAFTNCIVTANSVNIHLPKNLTASARKIRYVNCEISLSVNASIILHFDGAHHIFIGGSIEYNGNYAYGDNFIADFIGVHFEQPSGFFINTAESAGRTLITIHGGLAHSVGASGTDAAMFKIGGSGSSFTMTGTWLYAGHTVTHVVEWIGTGGQVHISGLHPHAGLPNLINDVTILPSPPFVFIQDGGTIKGLGSLPRLGVNYPEPGTDGYLAVTDFIGIGTQTPTGGEAFINNKGPSKFVAEVFLTYTTTQRPVKTNTSGGLFGDKIDLGNPATDVTGTLQVIHGGTDATTIAGARTNLAVYSKSEVDALVAGFQGQIDALATDKANHGTYGVSGGGGGSVAI